MRTLILSIAMLAATASASAQDAAAPPDWMSGYWLDCERGEQVAENWIGAGSGVLLGTNLTRGAHASFEFLRIAANDSGGLSYFSMPNGAPVTEFAMIVHEGRRVVFENRAHDFPQRIIYWRDGARLHARIEGEINGRSESMDWTFRRARSDEDCRR